MRKLTITLLFQFIFSVSAFSNSLFLNEDGGVVVETDRYFARFSDGALVQFENKLTGETYTEGNFVAYTGIKVRDGGLGAHVSDREFRQISPLACELIYRENDIALHTFISVDVQTQDLIIQQKALSQSGGIERIAWGFSHLSHNELELIAPIWGGQVITNSDRYDYPGRWEAQLAILQGHQGGLFIRSDDREYMFKVMEYRPEGDNFKLTFWHVPHAPFSQAKEITAPRWRLNAYHGDWQVPARIYRDWMHASLKPSDRRSMPAWVQDIELVVIHADPLEKTGTDVIEVLSRHVNPTKTLLYLTGWRKAGWRWNYPDYTATDNFSEFMSVAHGYGFRVMLHVNMVAVSPAHPTYAEFEPYHILGPYTGEKGFTHSEGPLLRQYAAINPASRAFRKMLVNQFSEVWETYRVDAFHLDLSMMAGNDGNGLIDGFTLAEGNILLHKELREAIPGIVLGGEGINEVNYLYESFTQYHLIRSGEQPHLINAFLFSPYVRFYGHLGLPNPDRYPEQYQGFAAAYEFWGAIPTVRLDGIWDLDPDYTVTYQILENASDGAIDLTFARTVWEREMSDVNNDGVVNIQDLILVSQFGSGNKRLDVNNDGVVNILDLVIVSRQLGG